MIAQSTFPSEDSALAGVRAWLVAAELSGRRREELAAILNTSSPSAVLAKFASRRFWIELGMRDRFKAELERKHGAGLLVFSIDGTDVTHSLIDEG